mmetsp:Transcript_134560/g.287909  ORF Transcript_134560/g.287909 Transcript_134560/m.287909 type:complete len:366 (+) Transcript_134560:46-1143(+)
MTLPNDSAAESVAAVGVWLNLDVASAANAGSFQKARALVKSGSVRILIRCADGAVEASVRSESSNEEYAVRATPPGCQAKAIAKCNCYDFKRRGGLCKHGAAVLLALQAEGGEPSSPLGCYPACAVSSELPPTPTADSRRQRRGSGAVAMETAAKRARLGGPAACPTKAEELEDVPEPVASTPPPVVQQPRFPKHPATAEAALGTAEVRRRGLGTVRASMTARQIRAQASAGSEAGLKAGLRRWGDTTPLEDAAGLLRLAVVSDPEDGEAGSVAAASLLLRRPEAAAAVSAADEAGRTPLHAAVAASKLSMCRLLIEHRADLGARDRAGRTPFELARKRRLDASLHQNEDPIAELLRRAAADAGA